MALSKKQIEPKNPDFYNQHIRKWQKSGISQKKYCISAKIPFWTFCYWRKKLLQNNKREIHKETPFIPLLPPPTQMLPRLSSLPIEGAQRVGILLPNGIQLTFPLTVTPALLSDYMKMFRVEIC